MTQPVLYVQMLGGFSLYIGANPIGPLPSRSASSLLAFLIVHRDRPQTRDLLAGRFWSDLAEDRARRRLSNALWQIRAAGRSSGGMELLSSSPSTIQFNPAIETVVDAEVFMRGLDQLERRGRGTEGRSIAVELAELVETYRGELLSGHYDEWIDDQRSKVRERYHSALSQLVLLSTGSADYEGALRHARVLVAADPLREEWHRDVMRLCALNGQVTGAERQYEACATVLRHELGAEPSRETSELIERIRKDAAAPPVPVPSAEGETLPLVGRSVERAALLGRVNELVGGKGGVVLIEGDPGIGKSRLVEEVATGAEWRGVQVLLGTHSLAGALTPYAGLREALEPVTGGLRGERLIGNVAPIWLREASTVLQGLRELVEPVSGQALRPTEEPWRTVEALAQVILAQSHPKPTILVLEDLHWCDDDTMRVLVQLGDRLIDSRVLICLTYQRHEAQRSPAVWAGITELEARPGSTRHVIPALDRDEVRQLATSELGPGRFTEGVLDRLAATTGGNPYMILELLRSQVNVLDESAFELPGASLGRDSLDARAGAGGPIQRPAFGRLAEMLTRRVASSPPDVQAVLRGVAVLAAPATTPVMSHVVELDWERVNLALGEAVDLGFLVETERGCEFVHDQTRQAVYDAIETRSRAGLHGRIVDTLAGTLDVSIERLAHHAWLAGRWDHAYQYHSQAGERALAVKAHQTAAEHLAKADQAAISAGLDDGRRVDDLFAYEHVLDILGQRDDQQQILKRLADLDDLDLAIGLKVCQRQAWLLANTDRGPEAARLALEAVDQARASGHATGELLTILGWARAWSGDRLGAIEPLEQAVAELDDAGGAVLTAQLMLGRTCFELGRLEAASRHLEAAHARAKAVDDARNQVEALSDLAILHHTRGDETEAERAFLAGLDLAGDIGYRHGEGRNLVNLAVLYMRQGRGGKALDLLTTASKVFTSLGNGRADAVVKANASELAHLILGDDDLARAHAGAAAVLFRRLGDQRLEAVCLVTLASIDRRDGRRRLARRRLKAARTKAAAVGDIGTEVQALLHLALVELDLGRFETGLADADAALALGRGQGTDALSPVLLAIAARALIGLGDPSGASNRLNRSIAANKPGSCLSHLAAWWNAQVLGELGDSAAAASQVALAHDMLAANLADVPEPVARRAWTEVAEHRAIAEARERYFEDKVTWQVPSERAPTGRALDAGEFVGITWTRSHPDDWGEQSPAARRQMRLKRLIDEAREQGGAARVVDVAAVLGVSERTIKRDLARLRAEGHQIPVRRGAPRGLM